MPWTVLALTSLRLFGQPFDKLPPSLKLRRTGRASGLNFDALSVEGMRYKLLCLDKYPSAARMS